MEALAQSQTIYLASLAGGIAFSLSGFLAGTRKNLDWMGLFILAFLTANGGGILRDLLTDRPPVVILSNAPFMIALGVTLAGVLLKLHRRDAVESRWLFVICDAVGLSAFAITGALVAMEGDVPFFGFITLAFLTAAGGAILRDMLVNDIPAVLHSGFYGSIAILIAVAIYALDLLGLVTQPAMMAVFAGGVMLRIIAYQHAWKLPRP